MGSSISSLLVEPALQELEKVACSHYEPAFWRRHVDDSFVLIERSRLADSQDLLSGIFPDIQSTEENENAGESGVKTESRILEAEEAEVADTARTRT
nr:unnamed protein product [Spirometra erinaceieuropaei]